MFAINAILRNLLGEGAASTAPRIDATDLSTFPDVSVFCGETQTSQIDDNAIVNPSVLVEVTSRTTEDYDGGDKLSDYKQLPSLQAVLVLLHRRPRITVVAYRWRLGRARVPRWRAAGVA